MNGSALEEILYPTACIKCPAGAPGGTGPAGPPGPPGTNGAELLA